MLQLEKAGQRVEGTNWKTHTLRQPRQFGNVGLEQEVTTDAICSHKLEGTHCVTVWTHCTVPDTVRIAGARTLLTNAD